MTDHNPELEQARRELRRAAQRYRETREELERLAEECKRLNVKVRRLGGTRAELVGQPFGHFQVTAILREAGLVKPKAPHRRQDLE